MDNVLQPGEHDKRPGLEDVWALFRESDRRMQETDRQMQETDRRMQETDRRMQETDRLIKELTEKSEREWEESGRRIERMIAQTDRQLKRTDKQIGDLGNRFGELAEHLVTPNIVEKFRNLGYAFTKAGPDVEFFSRDGKTLTEVDVWLENGEFALAAEIKAHLREQDVDRHIKRMEILRRYFDERGDTRKLLGAAAGAVVNAEVRDYALGKGLYVIEQSGDTVKIDAPDGFTPKVW
jgi:hypothetical protein